MARILSGLALLESAFAGGVTLITHGFNGNVDDWVIPMAGQMAGYPGFPGNEATCYVLEVTGTGPASVEWREGVKPNLSDSGEIFIKLDWSAVAGLFQASSDQVAAAAASALTDPTLISTDTGGRALAELPLHLIGHSRGASVVTEMAREFGERGIWVDQVTTLDPYPVFLFGDEPVVTWENVLYADNYWQEIGASDGLTGEPLAGAFNRELVNLDGGNSSSHSDVHLWYHGTAELDTPATAAEADITATMRGLWWTVAEDGGAVSGFHFSRLGGGDRLSTFQPVDADAIHVGFNRRWDLGAGTGDNRTSLPSNSGAWPNVIRCQHGGGTVSGGATFDLGIHYQAGASASGTVACSVVLDSDANPWNGNEITIDAGMLSKTGTGAVSQVTLTVDPEGVPAGSYHVGARLIDGGNSRTLYADGLIEIISPLPSIDRSTLGFEGGMLKFDVNGLAGQTVVVRASTDLEEWTEIATQLLTSDRWEFSDPAAASLPARFYQVGLASGEP